MSCKGGAATRMAIEVQGYWEFAYTDFRAALGKPLASALPKALCSTQPLGL